jgi:hypothetical protein
MRTRSKSKLENNEENNKTEMGRKKKVNEKKKTGRTSIEEIEKRKVYNETELFPCHSPYLHFSENHRSGG